MEKTAEAGLFGMLGPPPFGGAGGDWFTFALSVEGISAASRSELVFEPELLARGLSAAWSN